MRPLFYPLGFVITLTAVPLSGVLFLASDLSWLVSATCVTTILLFIVYRCRSVWPSLGLYSLIQCSNAGYFASYYLQGTGFNARFFYHIRIDIIYAGLSEFLPLIIAFVFLFGFGNWLMRLIRRAKATYAGLTGYQVATLILAVGLGFYFFNPVKDTISYIRLLNGPQNLSPELRHILRTIDTHNPFSLPRDSERKNLVFLYLESVEQSHFDQEYFPDLMPELDEIRLQSIDFTQVNQVPSASWTISGMVASLCSLPLHSPYSWSQNTLTVGEEFMSGARCLSDVLAKQGYHTEYLAGARTRFAGKEHFLKSHQYQEVSGKDQLEMTLNDKEYKHDWGLYDDSMYAIAKKRLAVLSQQDKPFFLNMLTLDTHHPSGHISKSCREQPEVERDTTMERALHCADKLAADFIRHIRQSPYSGNTIIVVMGDHIAMRNSMWKKMQAYPKKRRLLFFINTPEMKGQSNENPGSHYDVAPSILDALGFNGTRQTFGMGKSLLRGRGFLHEHGYDIDIGAEPAVRQKILSLWNEAPAGAKQGLAIGKNGDHIRVGKSIFQLQSDGWGDKASALLAFHQDTGELVDIEIWPYMATGMGENDISWRIVNAPDKVFLAVSAIQYIKDLLPTELRVGNWPEEPMAYFFGAAGNPYNVAGRVPSTGEFVIDSQAITQAMDAAIDPDEVVLNFNRLNVLGRAGLPQQIGERYMPAGMGDIGSFRARSCSLHTCDSIVEVNSKRFELKRGISIFGVEKGGREAVLIQHLDGCLGNPLKDEKGLAGLLSLHENYRTWFIAIHDTAACQPQIQSLKTWANVPGIEELKTLRYREPYFSIYSQANGVALEYRGRGRSQVNISFNGQEISQQ